MSNLPDPAIKKDRSLVRVYANEILIITKGFTNRDERGEWMERMTEALKGIDNFYFELSYYYTQRLVPQYEYTKRGRDKKKGYLIEKTQRQEFTTPKSFERAAPAEYSNPKYF